MHLSALDILCCPETGQDLHLEEGALVQNDKIIEGILACKNGKEYTIKNGMPVFLTEKQLFGKAIAALDYYSKNANVYDDYLPIAFDLYNVKERDVRDLLTSLLSLEKGQRILDLTAGSGKDSAVIAQKLQDGEIWLMDITREMLDVAFSNLSENPLCKEFVVASGCALPFKDDSFDALFSFTGLGSFPDVKKGLNEMSRVVRTGGKVVFCEKSVPPWLRDTEYGKILIEANPMFLDEIPLEYLPIEARNVEVRWIMENAFYVISYTVGSGEPCGNFSIELPGPRGGSFLTRYYGKLEGVTLETKALAYKAREASGKSMHKWLDEVIRRAAEQELNSSANSDREEG